MRSLLPVIVLGLGTLASVSPAQVPQRLETVVTTDTSSNTLTVQNRRGVPVAIYVEHGQFDRRLGVVPAGQTARLRLPPWLAQAQQTVRLFAHPEGEVADLQTQEFSLQTPARLAMVVPARGAIPPGPNDVMTEVIPPEALADATLTVDNPRSKAVTVYAMSGPFEIRLGQVDARSRATLRLPKSAVAGGRTVKLFVHPDGGVDLASQTMEVRPGQHLGLRVPRH